MSLIFYDGPSQIDGSTPVLGLLTGHETPSRNEKTGPMLQTWIVLRDMPPVEAVRTGDDAAVCGNCIHRGSPGFEERSCYVRLDTAPTNAWRCTRRSTLSAARRACAGRRVRAGAYGNPSAIPYEVWHELLRDADAVTGYEHEWMTCDQRFQRFCMASVETRMQAAVANTMGWRTYRTMPQDDGHHANEVLCPAYTHKTQCYDCKLCDGTTHPASKNIAAPVHGLARSIKAFEAKSAAPVCEA